MITQHKYNEEMVSCIMGTYGNFDDYVKSARATFNNGCSSPQKSISISFNGDPGNLGGLLNPKGISNFSISFSNDGISTTINWADRPAKPATMDYFGSKTHLIKFYK